MSPRTLPHLPLLGALLLLPLSQPAPDGAWDGVGRGAATGVRADSGRKLALIIAIARYPRASGYSRLSSDNDVPLIRAALLRQGFDSAAIRVLADTQATRAGILRALDDLAGAARPGDVVVIHYSGHGHQITDDNGDELDGLDEVLVPFDARADVDPATYHGEFHVRDDELEPRLLALRTRVAGGGNVVMFIDACHSGSATRSALPVRGGLPPIGTPARAATRGGAEGGDWVRTAAPTRGGGASADGLAPMVIFSAARQDQLASEVELKDQDETAGSLSVGLSRVLANLDGGARLTYRGVFDQLKGWMQGEVPLQTPQLEGDADVQLFSGRAVVQKPYHRVRALEGDSLLQLDGGTLVGLLPGSRLAFHAVGTADPSAATPVGQGVVVRADELGAVVRPDGPARATDLRAAWAFVTEYAFAEFRVRVRLDPAIPAGLRQAIAADFSRSGVIQLSEQLGELMIRPVGALTRGAAPLTVAWTEDTTVALLAPVDATTPAGRATLTERVRTLARSAYLKQVAMVDPRIRVRIELVPATHVFGTDGSCDFRQSDTTRARAHLSAGNQWVLQPQDGFLLRFINEGTEPAYIAVLDLMPDGEIGQLFPRPELSGEDNLLPPGGRYTSTLCYYATEPFGTEVFKLFATRRRVDFQPVLTQRGPTRSGSAHPLERLLGETYTTTRTGTAAAPQGTGTTATLTLQIVPPTAP
ncbi:MAG: caspase family protein [Gemmatimonadetes bacterium]|nr:caspase family protein [Gemmatimonadota bacterium]